MALDQEVCQACRRPRDELEIQRGRDQLRERAEKLRRRPLVAARWALGVGVLALAFHERRFFFGLTSGLRDEIHQEINNVENPAGPKGAAPKTAIAAAAIAMLRTPPASESTASGSAKAAPEPAGTAPPRTAVRPKEPKEPDLGGLRLYGVVYDMKSLQPLAYASIKLNLAGGAIVNRADENGHYQIDFSPSPNDSTASVSVSADGYRDGQIEDPESSYLRRPLKERLEFIAGCTPADLEAVPL
jgi:hypothetical protein